MMCLNRLDEAKVTFDQAFAHKLESGYLRLPCTNLLFCGEILRRWSSR